MTFEIPPHRSAKYSIVSQIFVVEWDPYIFDKEPMQSFRTLGEPRLGEKYVIQKERKKATSWGRAVPSSG
jgi:hypothetical protein